MATVESLLAKAGGALPAPAPSRPTRKARSSRAKTLTPAEIRKQKLQNATTVARVEKEQRERARLTAERNARYSEEVAKAAEDAAQAADDEKTMMAEDLVVVFGLDLALKVADEQWYVSSGTEGQAYIRPLWLDGKKAPVTDALREALASGGWTLLPGSSPDCLHVEHRSP